MVFRQNEPRAQEIQEKLRHSMQSSGGIRRVGTGRSGGNLASDNTRAASAAQFDTNVSHPKKESAASPQTQPNAPQLVSTVTRPPAAAAAAHSKPSLPANRQSRLPPPRSYSRLPPGLAPIPSTSHSSLDDAGSHADWWQCPESGSESVISYPMTAVGNPFKLGICTRLLTQRI